MKARIENGNLILYGTLPQRYKSERLNVAGGFDKLDSEIHRQEGFVDVVVPDIDPVMQELGEIYLDQDNDFYTYHIINKQFDLQTEKQRLLLDNDTQQRELLFKTDPYVTRANDPTSSAEIPQWVIDNRTAIRSRHNVIETEITNLTEAKSILSYVINYETLSS